MLLEEIGCRVMKVDSLQINHRAITAEFASTWNPEAVRDAYQEIVEKVRQNRSDAIIMASHRTDDHQTECAN